MTRAAGAMMEVGPDRAYNEQAFHYFLANERRRAAASNRPVVLLLVENAGNWRGSSDSAEPEKLLSGLSRCLRDTDIVGWYEERRVAGAVLTHLADDPTLDPVSEVQRRVQLALNGFSPRVRVRTVASVSDSEGVSYSDFEADRGLRRVAGDSSTTRLALAGQRS